MAESPPNAMAENAAPDAPRAGRYVVYALFGLHLASSPLLCVFVACGVMPRDMVLVVLPLISLQAALLTSWAVLGPGTLLRRMLGFALGEALLLGLLVLLAWHRIEALPAGSLHEFLRQSAAFFAGATAIVGLLAARGGIHFRRRIDPEPLFDGGVPSLPRRLLLLLPAIEFSLLLAALPAMTNFLGCALAHGLVLGLIALAAFHAVVARGRFVRRLVLVPAVLLGCLAIVFVLAPKGSLSWWFFLHLRHWTYTSSEPLGVTALVVYSLAAITVFAGAWLVRRSGWRLSCDAAYAPACDSPPPRAWRFSLRDCLTVLLVLGVTVGVFKRKLDEAQAQRSAAAEVARQGGQVIYLGGVVLPFSPRFISQIAKNDFLDVVFAVDFDSTSNTRVDLACLKGLPHVRLVEIYASAVRDDQLRHLAHRRELQYLYLRKIPIREEDIASIGPLVHLTSLSLRDTGVTSRAIARLPPLPELSRFDIEGDDWVAEESVNRLNRLPSLESLNVRGRQIDDAKLGLLAKLTNVKSLDLEGTKVTDDGLIQLAAMRSLEATRIWQSPISNAGLKRLKQARPELQLVPDHLPDAPGERDVVNAFFERGGSMEEDSQGHVTSLDANRWRGFEDDDCRLVAQLERLESLDLSGTKVTDAGLAHLAKLECLSDLDLAQTAVTDAGLAHLAQLKYLSRLRLSETAVTGAGLAHLKNLDYLITVDLDQTAVSDAGIANPQKLPNLNVLNLRGTAVTPAGVRKLGQALPNCVIIGP